MCFVQLTSTICGLMIFSHSLAHAAPVNLEEATKIAKIGEKRRSVAKRIIEGCRYDMYLNPPNWGYAPSYEPKSPESLEQPIPFFISVMSDPDLRSESLRAMNYREKEYKSLGSEERLQSLIDLAKDAEFQKFDQAILEIIKINIIQELCANGLQSKANAIWETLDHTQFTMEWMQWQSLVCVAKSASNKADIRVIDQFIAKRPESIIGYKAKLMQLSHAGASDPKTEEKRRADIRNLLKYLLLNFDYSAPRIRVKCLFNVDYFLFNKLHISTAQKLFGMLCQHSNATEAKDVSDFADKLQSKPFFRQQNELTRSFQGTMLEAYQQLNSNESTAQAGRIVHNSLGHAF
jgi:hypothetical protein